MNLAVSIAIFLLLPFVLLVSYWYADDLYEMWKSNKEYSMLKEALWLGMERDEVFNKLNRHGYVYSESGYRGSGSYYYYEKNFDNLYVYFKSLKWPPPTIHTIAYLSQYIIGYYIALDYPVSVTLRFNNDKLIAVK